MIHDALSFSLEEDEDSMSLIHQCSHDASMVMLYVQSIGEGAFEVRCQIDEAEVYDTTKAVTGTGSCGCVHYCMIAFGLISFDGGANQSTNPYYSKMIDEYTDAEYMGPTLAPSLLFSGAFGRDILGVRVLHDVQ